MARPVQFDRRSQKQIKVYLRAEAREQLKEVADLNDTSVQQMIEEQIELFLKENYKA